jgi:hypothetical protein
MDRGMVSEENLEYLRKRQDYYLVGTPKSKLKRFEREFGLPPFFVPARVRGLSPCWIAVSGGRA